MVFLFEMKIVQQKIVRQTINIQHWFIHQNYLFFYLARLILIQSPDEHSHKTSTSRQKNTRHLH